MSEGISYHNKDILFKFLSELYENVALLDVFNIKFDDTEDVPKIKQLLPSEFPAVRADEKRSDTLFELSDGSLLMLEYESNSRIVENHIKYVEYIHRIMHRYYQKEGKIRKVRVVVVYTSDVTEVKGGLDAGDLQLRTEAILLHEYNGDAILEKISNKIDNGDPLTDEDHMKLSFAPLMHSRFKTRQEMIKESIELAKHIPDEREQVQVIAGILTATDKFIDKEYAKQVRSWLKMTQVGRIIEVEIEEAVEKAQQEKALEIARLLKGDLPDEVIAKKTGLDLRVVKKLKTRE